MTDQFEQTDADLRQMVQIKDALLRLMNSPDWKLVIEDTYKVTYVADVMKAYSNVKKSDKDLRHKLLLLAQSAEYFEQFCNVILENGENAELELQHPYHEAMNDDEILQ